MPIVVVEGDHHPVFGFKRHGTHGGSNKRSMQLIGVRNDFFENGGKKDTLRIHDTVRHSVEWIGSGGTVFVCQTTAVMLAKTAGVPSFGVTAVAHPTSTRSMVLDRVPFVVRSVETMLAKDARIVDGAIHAVEDQLALFEDVTTDGVLAQLVKGVKLFSQGTVVGGIDEVKQQGRKILFGSPHFGGANGLGN